MHTCVSHPSPVSPSPKNAHAQGIFINLPITYAYYVHSYMYTSLCSILRVYNITIIIVKHILPD